MENFRDFWDYESNQDIRSQARSLQQEFKLTDFEALKIAVESQRNCFLYRFFALANKDNTLSITESLEMIAIEFERFNDAKEPKKDTD